MPLLTLLWLVQFIPNLLSETVQVLIVHMSINLDLVDGITSDCQ